VDDVHLEIPMSIPRLDRLEALVSLPATDPALVHLELRFDEKGRINIDGEKVAEHSTRHYWESGLHRRTRTTTGLVRNSAPLMLGGDPNLPAPYGPYRGLVDDVQVFNRGLNAGQVKLLHRFGTCEP
jgi:hypothetical protein